jgi:hypothetical protein
MSEKKLREQIAKKIHPDDGDFPCSVALAKADSIITLFKDYVKGCELTETELLTDDCGDTELRKKAIPLWDILYIHERNKFREVCKVQSTITSHATISKVMEGLE